MGDPVARARLGVRIEWSLLPKAPLSSTSRAASTRPVTPAAVERGRQANAAHARPFEFAQLLSSFGRGVRLSILQLPAPPRS